MSNNVAFINRSLTTVFNELQFLKESGVISDALYNEVTNALPKNYSPGSPPVPGIASGGAASFGAPLSKPPSNTPPGAEIGEVLYDFQNQQPTDLGLRKGDQVLILEKLNPDWWRGRDLTTNQEGIFPSNYVHIVSGNSSLNEKSTYAPPANPQYPGSVAPGQAPYSAPPPSQSAPPYYPPPSTNYYQPPPQPQPQPQQVVVQQDAAPQQTHHGSDAFKKFGSKLGNAAIFGAGATLGSDLVNSIF